MASIPGGYVLQPRKLDQSRLSGSPPHIREIWSYLVRRANYYDNPRDGLLRGQLYTSYSQIINDLSWHVGYRKESYRKHHCETAMKLLTKESMITTTKTTRGMIVTICNYDYYQNPDNYETDSETVTKPTRKPHDNRTISEEVKKRRSKEKEELNKTLLSGLSGRDDLNQYEILAIELWNLVKGNLAKYAINSSSIDQAKYKTWVNPIRLAMEKDGRMEQDFKTVFDYLRNEKPVNGFSWAANILSPEKLREKFPQILIKAKTPQRQQPQQQRRKDSSYN